MRKITLLSLILLLAPALASASCPSYQLQWPLTGSFFDSYGLNLSHQNELMAANRADGKVYFFTQAGAVAKSWPVQYPAKVLRPYDVVMGNSDWVYVTDDGNQLIQRYDKDGNLLNSIAGGMGTVRGIAVDGAGNVYVANSGKVTKWDPTLSNQLLSFGLIQNGYLISDVVVDAAGNVYESDTNNNRILKFDSTGVQTAIISSPDLEMPGQMALDAAGNLYVTELGAKHRVLKFATDGSVDCQLGTTGTPSPNNGLFNSPRGLVLDASGTLWTSEYGNKRAQKFAVPVVPSVEKSTKGRDFWVVVPAISPASVVPQAERQIWILADQVSHGQVVVGGCMSVPFTAGPGAPAVIPIPSCAQQGYFISGFTFSNVPHVTSDADVSVIEYSVNHHDASVQNSGDGGETYLAFPVATYGTEYICLSYPTDSVAGGPYKGLPGSGFAVIASEDNTTVTVDPSATVETNPTHPAHVPVVKVLQKGQAWGMSAELSNVDLTGSIIKADKPIAAFGMNNIKGANIGAFDKADPLYDQLEPLKDWGTEFITAPLKENPGSCNGTICDYGETFRVMAGEDGTSFTINGGASIALNKGQFYETILTTASVIQAQCGKLEVGEFFHGSGPASYIIPEYGDPSMVVVPPINGFSLSARSYAPGNAGYRNFANVVVKNSGTNCVTHNGIPVSGFTAVGASGYSYVQLSLGPGENSIQSCAPMYVKFYGYAKTESYGHVGARVIGGPDPNRIGIIEMEPLRGSYVAGENRCLTIQLNPAVVQTLHYNITGANPGSGNITTDAAGHAQICYTGTHSGVDSISVSYSGGCVPVDSHASWNWTSVVACAGTCTLPSANASGIDIGLPGGLFFSKDGSYYFIDRGLTLEIHHSATYVPARTPELILNYMAISSGLLGGLTGATLNDVFSINGMLMISERTISAGVQGRVFIYNSMPTGGNQNPDVVIGDPGDPNDSHLSDQSGLYSDGTKLFVCDKGNNRVLVYNHIPTLANKLPDFVIGQPNLVQVAYNHGIGAIDAQGLYSPSGVDGDGTRLFVADSGNHRVLVYNSFPTSNFKAADLVIGQPTLTSGVPNLDPANLMYPETVKLAGCGLYISDVPNNRVYGYDNVPGANGILPDRVVGQVDLISTLGNQGLGYPTSSTLSSPRRVAVSGSTLFVYDPGNNRTMEYQCGKEGYTLPVVGEPCTDCNGDYCQKWETGNGISEWHWKQQGVAASDPAGGAVVGVNAGLSTKSLKLVPNAPMNWATAILASPGSNTFGDTDLFTEVKVEAGGRAALFLRSNGAMDPNSSLCTLCYVLQVIPNVPHGVSIRKYWPGGSAVIGGDATVNSVDGHFTLDFIISGGLLSAKVNGVPLLTPRADTNTQAGVGSGGTVGFMAFDKATLYDNVKVNSSSDCLLPPPTTCLPKKKDDFGAYTWGATIDPVQGWSMGSSTGAATAKIAFGQFGWGKVAELNAQGGWQAMIYNASSAYSLGDTMVEARVNEMAADQRGFLVARADRVGLGTGFCNTCYVFQVLPQYNAVTLMKLYNGAGWQIGATGTLATPIANIHDYKMRFEIVGRTLKGYVNGALAISYTDADTLPINAGYAGVQAFLGQVQYDDFTISGDPSCWGGQAPLTVCLSCEGPYCQPWEDQPDGAPGNWTWRQQDVAAVNPAGVASVGAFAPLSTRSLKLQPAANQWAAAVCTDPAVANIADTDLFAEVSVASGGRASMFIQSDGTFSGNNSSCNTCYVLQVLPNTLGGIQIYKMYQGGYTLLGSTADAPPDSHFTLEFKSVGGQMSAYINGALKLPPRGDTSGSPALTSGKVGFMALNQPTLYDTVKVNNTKACTGMPAPCPACNGPYCEFWEGQADGAPVAWDWRQQYVAAANPAGGASVGTFAPLAGKSMKLSPPYNLWAAAVCNKPAVAAVGDTDFISEVSVAAGGRASLFIHSNGTLDNNKAYCSSCYVLQVIPNVPGGVQIYKMMPGDVYTPLGDTAEYDTTDGHFTLEFVSIGGQLSAYINGNLALAPRPDNSGSALLTSGKVGVMAYAQPTLYDNLKVNNTSVCDGTTTYTQRNSGPKAGHEPWLKDGKLLIAAPSPARDETTAFFKMEEAGSGKLSLISLSGETVWRRELKELAAGEHRELVPLKGLASGIYFFIFEDKRDAGWAFRARFKFAIVH